MDFLFFDPNSLIRLGAQADAATGGHRVALLALLGAQVLIYILGYTLIGRRLWQWGKDLDERKRQREQAWAESEARRARPAGGHPDD